LFLYINEKYFDHVESTSSKSEVIQTNITANMEIKEQKLGKHTNKINSKIKPLQKNRVSRRIERCFYAEIVTNKDVKTYNFIYIQKQLYVALVYTNKVGLYVIDI
jgi:acetyl-CoA carboxylase alpha subunit